DRRASACFRRCGVGKGGLTMMTPMLVQYLVGLCCLRNDPDAVDVTVGDLVLDEAANKRRDVDVTVTVKDHGGNIQAFKATEVKHEGRPLDLEPSSNFVPSCEICRP